MARKKKSILTPAIVILNVLIGIVIIVLLVLVAMAMNNESLVADETESTTDITVDPEEFVATTTTTPEVTTTTVSMTKVTTTTPDLSAPEIITTTTTTATTAADTGGEIDSDVTEAATTPAISTLYDQEFFANDLFIGDSISTGYYLFGYLPQDNVFAKIGLNPDSVRTDQVGGKTIAEVVTAMQPQRIYIMLGTNGLAFMGGTYMCNMMGELLDILEVNAPDSQVVLMAIPPVTKAHNDNKDEKIEDIVKYNAGLEALAEERELSFVDTYELLKDEDGYFASEYAEEDGLHFKGNTYKAVLSFLQKKFQD